MLLREGDTTRLDCLGELRPIRDALDVVGGKWKVLVLTALMRGNGRFGELRGAVPGISAKVLARELKDLEAHQLVRRTTHPDESPPRVSYAVTEYARSLRPVLLALHAWGVGHRRQILGG